MARFEYIVSYNLFTDDLDKLGKEGWELVSIIYVDKKTSYKGESVKAEKFYFKRELNEKESTNEESKKESS